MAESMATILGSELSSDKTSISSPEESLLEEASEERILEQLLASELSSDKTSISSPEESLLEEASEEFQRPEESWDETSISSPGESLLEGASEERVQGSHPSLFEPSKPIKHGGPTDYELETLAIEIGDKWTYLGHRLYVSETRLQEIHQAHDHLSEKGYHMLKHWKQRNGSGATYQALSDALKQVLRPDLAVKFCYINGQFALGNWIRGELLGKGGYGKVYKCEHELYGTLAVKIVEIELQYTEMHEVKALQNEISILKNVKHERIVTFYGSEEKDDHLYLFMDFMPGGSLSDHLKKNGVFSESVSKRYTKQILEGVYFLHSKEIIHRDIKGQNVLLDGKGNVKLADFGLSKVIEKIGSKTDVRSTCGTCYWMSPEVCRGEVYGRKADIWSVGCTVVEMLTGKPPLRHLEAMQALRTVAYEDIELTPPENVSQDAKEFIKAALRRNPEERPWSDELQRYTFVLNSTEDQ